MYRINVYIPSSHVESVKAAMFEAGAGRIGNYDQCCWQTEGQGQYRPLKGSQAYMGKTGKLESVSEFKVEMVCEKRVIKLVVSVMLEKHPYEEVAYDVSPVLSMNDF